MLKSTFIQLNSIIRIFIHMFFNYVKNNIPFFGRLKLYTNHIKYITITLYIFWALLSISFQIFFAGLPRNNKLSNAIISMAIIFLFANMIYDLPKKNLRQFVLHSYFPLGIRIKLAFIIESLFNCLNWLCVMLLYLPHLIMQPILYKWQGALFLIQFLFVCIILLLLGILINLIDFNIYTRKFTTSLKVKATVLLILLGLFYYYYHDYLYMLKKIMNDILDGRLHQVLINLVAFPEYDLYHHLLDEGFVLGITLIIFLALTCLLKITAKTIKDFQNSKYSYGNLGNNIFILYFVNTKRRIN